MSQRSRSLRQLGSILRRCGLPSRTAGNKWNLGQARRNRAWIGLEALEQRLQLSGGPTLTTITTQVGATEHSAYTITYANLLAASNAADTNSQPISFRIDSVSSSGTLTENGSAVTPGTTLLATGQSLVWTPNASGQINAFTVDAFDGTSDSTPAEPVKIAVAPGEVGYNEAYYLANNPDVKAAVIAGQFSSGEQHFDEYGRAEGRVPSEQAIGFNEQWYLDEYPAVASLVHNGTYYSGLEYYLEVGKGQGELPGPLAVGYNEAFYLETYPDVAAAVRAGTFLSGYEHYVLYGFSEKREPGPVAVGFSESFYLATYPDVATAVREGLFVDGFEHYVLYGQSENRLPGPLDVGFDAAFYLETNPDVATAVHNGAFISAYEHYVLYGDAEGRLPGPLAVGFNETYYLDNNPDVASAVNAGTFVSGFEHYVLYGHAEGRLPGPLAVGFDETYYLTEYPDVAAAVNEGLFISGFEHYVLYGMSEGRFPHAQTPTVTGGTTSASEIPPNPGTTLASQVVPNLTINDTDTSDLSSATIEMTDPLTGDSITLGNGYSVQNGNEVYNASSQNTGLTVVVNSAYSLTLNGTAAFSTYEDALDSIVFYTTNGDSSATRHVSVTVTASTGAVSEADVFTVNFTEAPPVVTGNTTAKVLTNPNDTTIAAQLITNLTVGDPNVTAITSATVTLSGDSGDFMSLDEALYTLNGSDEVINSNSVDTGVALSGNGTGTLSFTGAASASTYQGILSAIEFFTTSGDTTTLRHVSVSVTDALSLTSTADDFSFDFPVQTPVVSGINASESVTSPDPSTTLAAQLQPDLSILDLDSPNMTGAAVSYADPVSGDTLSIVGYTITDSEIGSTGITLAGNNTTGLTFSGTASQSTYEQVLNSVVFYTTSQETADSREVAVTVTDANSITSGIDYLTVLFTPPPPTVTGSTTSATVPSPNAGTTLAAQVVPDLTITDLVTSDLQGASASFTDAQTGDSLAIANGYTINGSNHVITPGSADTGISVTGAGTTTLTFSGSASLATYEGVLDAIAFYTTSGDTTDARDVNIVATSAGGASSADVLTVNFVEADPVVTGGTTPATLSYPNLTISAQLVPDLTVGDPNQAQIESAAITLTGVSGDYIGLNASGGYSLSGGSPEHILTDGATVDTGLEESGIGEPSVTITGDGSAALYQAILNDLVFYTTTTNVTTQRDVAITVEDVDSLTSAADDFSFYFPVEVTGGVTSATVSSPAPGVITAAQQVPSLTITDPTATTLSGASITITNAQTGDAMSLSDGYSINGSNEVLGPGSTPTGITVENTSVSGNFSLTFSGSASLATYQDMLNSEIFITTGTDYSDARDVSVTVTDANSVTSPTDTFDVNFPPAPSISGSTTPATVPSPAEGSVTAAQVSPDLSITDSATDTYVAATITITNAQTGDAMTMGNGYSINGSNQVLDPSSDPTGITAQITTGSGTFELSFSGSEPAVVYGNVLNAVIFTTTSTDYSDARDISVTVSDANAQTSAADTFDVSFPVAPSISGSTTPTEVDSPNPGVVTSAQVLPNLTITDSTTDTYYSASISLIHPPVGDTMTLGNGYSVDGDNNVLDPSSDQTGLVLTGNNTTSFSITGFVSAATYEEVLNSIVFYTTSTDVTDARDVSVTVTDANAQISAADTFDVSFPAVPTITGTTTPASVTVADGSNYAVQALPNLTVSSSPDITLVSVTMTTQVGGDYILLDSNLFTVGSGNVITGTNITISGNGTAATITLSGKDTAANYQAVLNALTFQTTSSDAATTRTVSVTLTNVAGQVSTADVFNVNYDVAPTVSVSQSFDEYEDFDWQDEVGGGDNASPYYEDPVASITYNTGTNLTGASMTALNDEGGGHVTGTEMVFDSNDYTVSDGEIYDSSDVDTGVSVTGYGTDTMTFSGSASVATYQAIINSIRFFNSSYSNPWYDELNFTITVTDQAGLSSTPASTVIYPPI